MNEKERIINNPKTDQAAVSLRIPASEIILSLWRKRYWLASVTSAGMIVSIVYALLATPQFLSTVQLMPVNPESVSNSSSLDMLGGVQDMLRQSSFLSDMTPGATAIGVLQSRTALDRIVNKLDLKKAFNSKTMVDARKMLLDSSTFTEDKSSGIVTIRVTDSDKWRAQQIAAAYIDVLNELLVDQNSSSAHRERVFLEDQLASVKLRIDETSAKLSQFSSHSGTLNPEGQGQALIVSFTQLQAQLISAKSDLEELKAKYSEGNVRVMAAQARIDELNRQIREMTAVAARADSHATRTDNSYPSFRELPFLDATYMGLSRQLATQQAVYETLTKQYEMAKVLEAKKLPLMKVLDPPDLAERRTSPRRTILVILGMLLSFLGGVAWITLGTLWKNMSDSDPLKGVVLKTWREIRKQEAVLS